MEASARVCEQPSSCEIDNTRWTNTIITSFSVGEQTTTIHNLASPIVLCTPPSMRKSISIYHIQVEATTQIPAT
jgi:hypothetical protein